MDEQLWYGKYTPLKLLSANGNTEVFLAEHVFLKEKRVLKRAHKGTAEEKLLRNEAGVLVKVNSPFVPKLFDFLDEEKEVVMVEEFFEGESLADLISTNDGFSAEKIFKLACSICNALADLHNGSERVIHCDLSPGNILVDSDRIKLIDFGTAEIPGKDGLGGDSFGTKGFCAPEQVVGEPGREETDIYALGRVIMALLEKANAEENSEKKLVQRMRRIAERAASDNPADRFGSVAEILSALERCRGRKSGKEKAFEKGKNSVCTIGIIGTHHGVGVTHTALSVASFLHFEKRKRVAVIELSGQSSLDCFGKQKESHGAPCRVKGLSVFPSADSLLAGTVRNGNFDYCILDLGCAPERRKQELLRCDIKLVVTDAAPWKPERRRNADRILDGVDCSKGWRVLVNFSDGQVPSDCRRLPVRMEWLRFSPNPFEVDEQNKKLFGKLLSAF